MNAFIAAGIGLIAWVVSVIIVEKKKLLDEQNPIPLVGFIVGIGVFLILLGI